MHTRIRHWPSSLGRWGSYELVSWRWWQGRLLDRLVLDRLYRCPHRSRLWTTSVKLGTDSPSWYSSGISFVLHKSFLLLEILQRWYPCFPLPELSDVGVWRSNIEWSTVWGTTGCWACWTRLNHRIWRTILGRFDYPLPHPMKLHSPQPRPCSTMLSHSLRRPLFPY